MAAHLTPERILQLGLAFWGSKTLLSAVELQVLSKFAGGSLGWRREAGFRETRVEHLVGADSMVVGIK